MGYAKDFSGWGRIKPLVDMTSKQPLFKEREIWWTQLGVNIGHEIDGKGASFRRPVLVVRKFSQSDLWAVPLSTKYKRGNYFYQFAFEGVEQSALLTQIRLIDSKRLQRRMGILSEPEFMIIKSKIVELMDITK